MNTDNWKKLDDYSNYRIYPDGRVYSEKRKIFLKPGVNGHGYLSCNFSSNTNKKRKSMSVHRLVALVHIPNPDNHTEVDHIDQDKLNNAIDNLRWVSRSENLINRSVSGSIPYRHISHQKTPNRFRIHIQRNKKFIFTKAMKVTDTLDDAVNVRNEQYKILGIDIDD